MSQYRVQNKPSAASSQDRLSPAPSQYLHSWRMMLYSTLYRDHQWIHQQNVNRSGSHTQSSQTLRANSPVLLSTSWYSQTPLALSNVLSNSARAFSGAPESTCSYGGTFRMLWDLTFRKVKFWSSWGPCADLQETSWAAETAEQVCGRLGAIVSQQWFLRFHNHTVFRLSYSSVPVTRFATAYYGMHYLSVSTYIHTVILAADGSGA